jgi:hypothetical protein
MGADLTFEQTGGVIAGMGTLTFAGARERDALERGDIGAKGA